jgi:hypothetical protein
MNKHPSHYFVLVSLLMVGLWGIYWFSYNPAMRMVIMIGLAVSYVVWGIVHHAHQKDLHIKIVVEYVLVAMLALLMFSTLLYLA